MTASILDRRIGDLRTCSAGVVAVVTAMVLPVLLGLVSLGAEAGHWYLVQREMQGAADAAAISAMSQYVADYPANSTTYQTVGVNYASLNGFTIPTQNVCLINSSGVSPGCNVLALDPRGFPPGCSASTTACVVVEITQNTMTWLSTQRSLEPVAGHVGRVQAIPNPIFTARAIVSVSIQSNTSPPTKGSDCILALANDSGAVTIHGNGNIQAACGISIDGGINQNVSGTPLGGITFNGANAAIHIGCNAINASCPALTPTPLVVAASSTGCPSSHCFWFNPSGTALPASAVNKSTGTADPYATQITTLFSTAPPLGVQTGGVATNVAGAGYTNGTCTFTVKGGTGTPAKFTATISGGKVTAIGSVTDPGAYTVFPTNPVSASGTCGAGTTAAKFNLIEGCFTWVSGGTPIAGRKYCSINLNGAGTTNFPAGSYYITGGDSNCVGFCVSSNNATVTSDAAGVTFFLMKGDGANSRGSTVYAEVSIASGSVSLCAPGTTTTGATCTTANFGTTCTNANTLSCLLFIQDPAATASTGDGTPTATNNTFSGNGTRVLSGLVYLPRQTFSESGNGPIEGCFGVIAKWVDVGGTPTFSNGCLPGNGIGGTLGMVTSSLINPRLYQ